MPDAKTDFIAKVKKKNPALQANGKLTVNPEMLLRLIEQTYDAGYATGYNDGKASKSFLEALIGQ